MDFSVFSEGEKDIIRANYDKDNYAPILALLKEKQQCGCCNCTYLAIGQWIIYAKFIGTL